MPVVIDEVNAEIAPENRGEQTDPHREATPRQQDIPEQVRRAVEREHYRMHRLSDR